MPSFSTINFAIRPNKNVERKLVFELLAGLEPEFPFSGYRYIGFGSMWFADFILAHRHLGITDLTSIQYDAQFAERARFNAPYRCIRVEEGDAATVLPTLPLNTSPSIIWLDYESPIGNILAEVGDVCARASSGTILMVTINASRERVVVVDEKDRREHQEKAFRNTVGDLAPASFSADFFDTSKYPGNIAATLISHLKHTTRIAGREELYEPMFNFGYADDAPMVTIGGMIANKVDRERLQRAKARVGTRLSFAWAATQTLIEVPPLTTREKLSLDQLFPAENPPTDEQMAAIGFRLKRAHVEAYHRYYARYPVFGEMLP